MAPLNALSCQFALGYKEIFSIGAAPDQAFACHLSPREEKSKPDLCDMVSVGPQLKVTLTSSTRGYGLRTALLHISCRGMLSLRLSKGSKYTIILVCTLKTETK